MTIETVSAYEANARRVAKAIGLTVSATLATPEKCPQWSRDNGKRCDHIHGRHYRVTLARTDQRRRLTFDFWNSRADADKGIEPGYYDVLACVSSDMSMSTDPDEIAEELGPMRPSQAIAAAKFAERLQAFFTEGERERLAEIQ